MTAVLIGNNCDPLNAFRQQLARDLRYTERALDRLSAGHGGGLVVEKTEGDVVSGSDGGANAKAAGMSVGAVAEVLENVRGFDERRHAKPGCTFTAHLRQECGLAVGHP